MNRILSKRLTLALMTFAVRASWYFCGAPNTRSRFIRTTSNRSTPFPSPNCFPSENGLPLPSHAERTDVLALTALFSLVLLTVVSRCHGTAKTPHPVFFCGRAIPRSTEDLRWSTSASVRRPRLSDPRKSPRKIASRSSGAPRMLKHRRAGTIRVRHWPCFVLRRPEGEVRLASSSFRHT